MGNLQNLGYCKDTLLILIILTLAFLIFSPSNFMSKTIPFQRKPFGHKSVCLRDQKCDVSSGKWVPFPDEPYYTDKSQCYMDIRQNCMKAGRPDTEYMKWRWQPDECDLPRFDGSQFLELVRGKSMAFVGDSVSRNQMQSLGCLLSSVAQYKNELSTNGEKFSHWYYPDYNFTLANLWSTHLVKSEGVARYEDAMNLYLDEVDTAWVADIKKFDFVILSSGHWFTKPLIFHNKGKVVGCSMCKLVNVTKLNQYYGYKMAFETVFRTFIDLKDFKGKVFLRTISPSHFEGGPKGSGFCPRKWPVKKEETEFDWLTWSYYMIQKEEFRVAKKKGKKRGLKFYLLDITHAMLLRPDGHPNMYGQGRYDDCLHWCMPGPVDLWNEILYYKLNVEDQGE